MDTKLDAAFQVEAVQVEARTPLQKVTTIEQLYNALNVRRDMPVGKLGDLMIDAQLITAEQLDVALQFQRHNEKKHLGEILIDLGFVQRDQLDLVLCQKLGIPFVDLTRFQIDSRLLKVLPDDLVRKNCIVPLC